MVKVYSTMNNCNHSETINQ